jgi:predicted nuclease with TOPRIM domain
LLYGGLRQLAGYPAEYHEKLDEYRNRIASYNYSLVSVKEAPLNVATEIFTRINTGGKELTLFEIMVAKTYDEKRNFDLSEKFDELVDDLGIIDYETISDATVLQTVAVILEKECTRNKILSLKKQDGAGPGHGIHSRGLIRQIRYPA